MTISRISAHWVCFDCRKMFRKPPGSRLEPPAGGYVCPECKQPMHDMGFYFEPPRRNAIKRWAILQLVADRLRFQSGRAKAFAYSIILGSRRPKLNGVKERLKEYKNQYGSDGQKLLAKITKER